MSKCYIELRKSAARGSDSIAADMMRHLHARQHLGRAIVVTSHTAAMLAAARKQWLKLARAIQKQRAQTLNADKILKYTHTIAHMQHMRFTAKSPMETGEASVYFLPPDQLSVLPVHCLSIYILTEPDEAEAAELVVQLPPEALIVDYRHTLPWEQVLGLEPKSALEAQVDNEWRQVVHFLAACKIDVNALYKEEDESVEAMDQALDTLLGVSRKFMQVANDFQHTLELARPLHIPKAKRGLYDALVLLAHRVQALSPGVFTQRFLEAYNEDDTFFLHDFLKEWQTGRTETPAAAYARHKAAGRHNLARAMLTLR